jgi:FtsZ-binding cell division protein ZapB
LGGHVEEIVRKKIPPTHSDLSAHQNLVGGKEKLVEKVTTDLGVLYVRIPVETGERADLLKIYDTHTMTLSQLKERIATLEHDIADVTHTKQALQTSYASIIEAHKTEQEHLEAANSSLSEISSKQKTARSENDVIFAEVNDLKQKIKALAAEEAKTEEAEAAIAAQEAAEAEQLAALRVKEKEEREAIALLKKSIIEARHTLQEHENHITGHKQTLGKVQVDLSSLHEAISTRDTEITGVSEEHSSTLNLYREVTRNIDLSSKRVTGLEYDEAKLAHLHDGLDDKIKELAHKEATEHHELEANSAKLGVLAIELDHLRVDIAKANATLSNKQKEYESKVAAAEIDIKVHESELGHRSEVHKRKEKEVAIKTAKVEKHKRHHDKKKKHEKKKKAKLQHHKKHKAPSSSSSSSSDSLA